MSMNRINLPDTVEELRALVIHLYDEKEMYKKRALFLESLHFARKTEKKKALKDPPGQLFLFNEAECNADSEKEEKDDEVITVAAHKRNRGHRRPLPEALPRKIVTIDIPEEDKVCGCGANLKVMREETSEKLCIIPRQIYIEVTCRPLYACPHCEGTETDGTTVKIAPMPPQLITHGIASPELVATVIYDKFSNHLPLYRQSNIFSKVGIDLTRATLSRWIILAAKKCQPLYARLFDEVVSGHVMHMDETRLQVLNEEGRANESLSTMWVMCGGEGRKVRFFHYDQSHGANVAEKLLKNFYGYLMTDGLKVYDKVGEREGLVHVSCLVHMRRRFADVVKMAGKKRGKGLSDEILDFISKLYRKEKILREQLDNGKLSKEEFIEARKIEHIPILDKIKSLLDENVSLVPPKSALGDAITYALKYWNRMVRYLDCAELPPDNNIAENAIRPVAVGRKNWLFAGSPRGANASTLFYTLIECAKANSLNEYEYLIHVLRNIASADTPEKIDTLLPWNVKSIHP